MNFNIIFTVLKIVFSLFALVSIVSLFFKRWRDLLYSIYLTIRYPKPLELCGIHAYTGLFGMGKTYSLCRRAVEIKTKIEKKGKKCEIYSNFGFIGQTGKITGIKDILDLTNRQMYSEEYKNTFVIILLDEFQNIFNQQDYASKDLSAILPTITQTRKLRMTMFITSTRLFQSAKSIREMCGSITFCKRIGSYYFVNRTYNLEELNDDYYPKKVKILFDKWWVLHPTKDKELYDTHEFVTSITNAKYAKDCNTRFINNNNNDAIEKTVVLDSKGLNKLKK